MHFRKSMLELYHGLAKLSRQPPKTKSRKEKTHMDFLNLAKKRYSVRSYTEQKVEKEKLEAILEAAHIAPTGGNCQPQHLIVVQNDEGLGKISKAANIYNAPLAIIVCSNPNMAWTRPFDGKNLADIDASIITDHMMLEATDLGLGSVWVCYFKPDVIKAEFAIPANLEPINILVIGYADVDKEVPLSADRHSKVRKPISSTASFEKL